MKTPKAKKPARAPKPKKPANGRARLLRSKLEALVARGFEGEKDVAAKKLERLLARYDFVAPAVEIKDMFRGSFAPGYESRWLYKFPSTQLDIASAVKWAIETATGLRASFKGDDLYVEAAPTCVPRLSQIANTLTHGMDTLWSRFSRAPGIEQSDRGLFIRGLWDGMMNDGRPVGQQLPARRIEPAKRVRAKKTAVTSAPGLGIHPYAVALPLGHQLRFETPLTDIVGNLEASIGGKLEAEERKQLT